MFGRQFDGFDERLISIFLFLACFLTDVSPAILVPFYDEDSSTIFVTGRGDTTIYAYGEEIMSDLSFTIQIILTSYVLCRGDRRGSILLPIVAPSLLIASPGLELYAQESVRRTQC